MLWIIEEIKNYNDEDLILVNDRDKDRIIWKVRIEVH
jgi:hypothetical protein